MCVKYRMLVFALLLSLGAHTAFFSLSVWYMGGTKSKAGSFDLPTLAVLVSVAEHSESAIAATQSAVPETLPSTVDAKRISNHVSIQGKTESNNASSSPLVLMADALDAQLQVIVEPNVEPDYGFADDVGGQVVLGLLIGTDGSVVWVGIESSEVDQPTTDYLVRAFGGTSFDVPTFRGRPVYALLRVEVIIPPKTTQSGQRGLR